MTTRTSVSSLVQHGNIDDALAAALLVDVPPDKVEIKSEKTKSVDHGTLAELFVSLVDVEEKSEKLARDLAAKEKRQLERQRQATEEKDFRLSVELQIYEQYAGAYSISTIKLALKHHNYDMRAACAELLEGTLVIDEVARRDLKQEPVINSFVSWPLLEQANRLGTQMPATANRRAAQLKKEVCEDIFELEREARRKHQEADHHRAAAFNRHPIGGLTSGALSTIAREDRREAMEFEVEANLMIANEMRESLDLHQYTVLRALHLIKAAVIALRKRRPNFRYLELIPGHGSNNPKNKPILKQAVTQWLKQEEIGFECPSNPGVVIVDLFSVPLKFGT